MSTDIDHFVNAGKILKNQNTSFSDFSFKM